MDDDVRGRFEADLRVRRERARDMLPSDRHAEFDAVMDHVVGERHMSAVLWQGLSPAQKALVHQLRTRERSVTLRRTAPSRYDVGDTSVVPSGTAPAATVRALVGHRILRWEGGEELAVLASRGLALVAFLDERN